MIKSDADQVVRTRLGIPRWGGALHVSRRTFQIWFTQHDMFISCKEDTRKLSDVGTSHLQR
jgi:hypothetical protein